MVKERRREIHFICIALLKVLQSKRKTKKKNKNRNIYEEKGEFGEQSEEAWMCSDVLVKMSFSLIGYMTSPEWAELSLRLKRSVSKRPNTNKHISVFSF